MTGVVSSPSCISCSFAGAVSVVSTDSDGASGAGSGAGFGLVFVFLVVLDLVFLAALRLTGAGGSAAGAVSASSVGSTGASGADSGADLSTSSFTDGVPAASSSCFVLELNPSCAVVISSTKQTTP